MLKNQFLIENKVHCYEVSGAKADVFLHGQLTNNIKALNDGEGSVNLLLNPKGKIQAGCYIWRRSQNEFLLFVDETNDSILLPHLKKFAALSKITLTKKEGFVSVCCGDLKSLPKNLLLNVGVEFFASEYKAIVIQTNEYEEPSYLIYFEGTNLQPCEDWFLNQGFKPGFLGEFELERIKKKHPKPLVDASSEFLPQEVGFDHALNFEKGCYLGQEVVARLHFRGHTNQGLQVVESDQVLNSSDIVVCEDKSVGTITSVAFDEKQKRYFGLVVLPHKVVEAQKNLFVNQKKISVCHLNQDL